MRPALLMRMSMVVAARGRGADCKDSLTTAQSVQRWRDVVYNMRVEEEDT